MKIFKNIIPVIKLFIALKYLAKYKNEIDRSKAAQEYEKEQAYILKATERWGTQLAKDFDIQINVTGRENLPETGPVVYVANHQGYADIPACCAVLNTIQFGFVAKYNLGQIPIYGTWIKRIRSVMIQRDDARASLRAIDEGVDFIKNGFSLLIFPEGTRSKGGPMKEFKKGSLRLATKPGVPVIPVTINGTYRIFEEPGYIKSGAQVSFTIHPAIETKGLDKNAANALSEEVETIIRNELARLTGSSQL